MADTSSEPRIWDEFLTERDKQVFAASGYGVRGGFGKRPALLIIDVNYGSSETSPSRSSNRQALEEFLRRRGLGSGLAAIEDAADGAARAKGVPVDLHLWSVRRSDCFGIRGAWAYQEQPVNKRLSRPPHCHPT